MAEGLRGAYGTMYDAALTRLSRDAARRRAQALQSANNAGVQTSGVGQLAIQNIDKAESDAAAQIGADLAARQDQERLADKSFDQRKELLGMQANLAEAAENRAYKRQRAGDKAALLSEIGGAATGGLLKAYFKKKKSPVSYLLGEDEEA